MKTRLPFILASQIIALALFIMSTNCAQSQTPAFWGMTNRGGTDDAGTIFKMAPDGTGLTVQQNFTFQNHGARPFIGVQLTQLANGKMYGVTEYGGINNVGVLFEYDPATNVYTRKIDFSTLTGKAPMGRLTLANNGKLYGMATSGGSNNLGAIFEYDPATNAYTKKIDFASATGSSPYGNSLYLHTNGKFYGMTVFGGANNSGVLFEYDPATNTYAKKIDFAGAANGANPYGSLMITSAGKVFGLTTNGGANNQGILFEYAPATNTITKKVDFTAANGSFPYCDLAEASNNRLYGVTPVNGSIFEYNPATNAFTKKIDLNAINAPFSYSTLVKGSNGKFYGMTSGGGATSQGLLFEYDAGTNTFTKKIDFTEATGVGSYGSLALASNGNFYGLMYEGGIVGQGVLFEYNASTNTYTKKIDLSISPLGTYPYGGLVRASNNKLYGMTIVGGANDQGVIFELDPITNAFAKKHDFIEASGSFPQGDLTQAANGKLYGLTTRGGATNDGTIFEFDLISGVYTKKNEFDDANGSEPIGTLVLASNNKLYGMTNVGGATGVGVIVEYDPATNALAKKVDLNNSVGTYPSGDLIQATNGKLYGLTYEGGTSGNGVLFEYDISTNTITPKVNFNGTNGDNPEGSLLQAPNGKLYGMTSDGGVNSEGVLFEYDIATDTYTKKFDFGGSASAGTKPSGSLALSPNGKLYGATTYGGTNGKGIIFEYDPDTSTLTKKHDFTGADGGGFLYGRLLFVKGEQTISFAALPDKTVGNAAFALAASSSANLSITYTSSNTAVATVSGNTVNIVGAGITTITASQPGDASYNAATSVSQTLTVNKINQTITFADITDKTVGDPSFALTASTTSSLPVSFSTVSNKITINGAQVSIVSAGRVTIAATQTGNANYNAATPVERSFCIKPAQPTITLSNLNSETPTLTSSAATGNQWYRNDVVIAGATNTVLTATEEGTYKVRAVVDDCMSDFSDEVVLVVTSIEENSNQISLFPNPTADWITVSLNQLNGSKQISIVNALGSVKESKDVEGNEATFNVAAYANGVYFVKVKMKNSVRILRFVKR